MALFWTIWAAAALGILLLATLIELNGARKGFHGANGIFMAASGYLTLLSSPVLFIVTWIYADFWTATKVWLIGAAAYGVLFAFTLKLLAKSGRRGVESRGASKHSSGY